MENDIKKSQLVWDMRIARNLLKRNPSSPAKYCRYCGRPLSEQCDCIQPFEVIDVKPARGTTNGSVEIFANTPELQAAIVDIAAELKAKDELKKSPKLEEESE